MGRGSYRLFGKNQGPENACTAAELRRLNEFVKPIRQLWVSDISVQ